MLQHDSDDRLLAALRGEPVGSSDPSEATHLLAAQRVGSIARTMDAEYADEPRSYHPGPSFSFDELAEALGSELSGPSPEAVPHVEPSNVVSLPRARSAQTWILSAAAALLVVVGAGVAFITLGSAGDEPDTVAAVELEALIDQGAASAELVGDGDEFSLVVDVSGVDPGDGYLELWLIDPEISQLISLGPIQDDGVYELPAGLDPVDFPLVDVSVETFDGDPSHGGDSVFRGQLEI